jgi:hypothetical protein
MNVFSKPIESEECGPKEKDNENISMNYIKYDNLITLTKYKIPQLKKIAKENKLHVSGSKPQLIERIHNYFIKCKKAVFLQKLFRGYIVKRSFKIRGKAFKNRKLCVNETDFYTLEPLEDIPFEEFYSYTDEKNFIYGFNIKSLIALYKQKGKIINPYNREKVDFKTMNEMFSLYKLCKIIFTENFKPEDAPVSQPQPLQRTRTLPQSVRNTMVQPATMTNRFVGNIIQNYMSNSFAVNFTPRQRELFQKMETIRAKPLETRIQELFMEIDLLGNYTQSAWFNDLDKRDILRLFRYLRDIWYYRGRMSNEVKMKISSLHDPFLNNDIQTLNISAPLEDFKKICISVMENIIYTGIDTEFQKLGALHVLSALTVVSMRARQNMMWLYESLLY